MQLIHTIGCTYSVRTEGETQHFSMDTKPLGQILYMSTPVIGERLTVKVTATGDPKDWALIVSTPVEGVHES